MTQSPYTSTSGEYLRYTMLLWMVTRGWILFLPLAATVTLAVTLADVRWAIVALAYLLVCVPMIVTPIAFSYILTPEARRRLSTKTVAIDSDKNVTLTYFETSDETGELIPSGSEIIPAADVKSIFRIGNKTIITLRSADLDIIIIPD